MPLQWKTIPYSDEVAEAVHTHVEADITDLSRDAITLQGRNVSGEAPTDGDALVWNDTMAIWEPRAGGGAGAAALDDLSDVAFGTPQTGHVLTFNETYWESAPPSGATTLGSLTDVTADTPQNGDILTYNGYGWISDTPPTDADTLDGEHASAFADAAHDHTLYGLTDVTLGTPQTGHVLTYATDHWESAAPAVPASHTHAGTDITSAVANATDADTLDGEHASAFADAAHTHVKADIADLTPGVEETGDLIVGFNDIASVNYAYQATVIGFSSYTAPHAPSRMLDGNSIDENGPTYWNAGAYTAGSYVTIDLGQPRPINYIGTLGSSTEGNRANFEVEYSTDDVTYTLAHRFSDITTAENAVSLPQTITARYWKIRSTGYTYGYNNWIMYTWELREFTGSIRTYPLAVGDNDQILVADDAQTLGVKWADHDHSTEFAPLTHTHSEADITDLSHDAVSLQGNEISTAAPQDGDTLVWNALAAKWTPGESVGSGGGGTLSSLLDVGIPTTPDNNQVLTWQTGAGQWKAISLPAAPTTARVREFDFQPEYPGAVIDPATLGDGLLEAFADASRNAYEWTVVDAAEQSAYIYLRWRLPPGFVSFAGPLKVTSKVSNVSRNCGVEVLGLYDAAGANAIAYVTLKNADWTEDSINLVAGAFAAGDLVLAKFRLFGQNTSVAYLAGIRIQYNGD